MKQSLLKSSILRGLLSLFFLVAMVGNAWGETVTYTVSSTTAVSTTGTAPQGSSASYSQTYGTKCQMTSGKTTTLTLSGFDGCTITGVTIKTKTNASSGAGSFTVTIGGTQKGSLSVSKLGSAYINKDITVTSTQVGSSETIVIAGSCTTNSVYCESYTITYTAAGKTALGTPANLSSSNVTGSTANLSWDAVANASSYKVKIGSTEYDTNTNSYNATDLEGETKYNWSVKALAGTSDTYSDGLYSGEATFTTGAFVATAGTYNVSMNNTLYGVSTGSNGTERSETKSGITIVSGCKSSASSKTYYDTNHIRYYADSYLKLAVPTGFNITQVVFTANGTWNSGPSASVGTYTNSTKTWAGSASQVVFSFSDQNRVGSIAVTYSADKTLQSVAVSGTPNKTTYEAGDSFDPTGLTVTGTYDQGDPETITKGITWSTPDALAAGQTSVGITATVNGITSPSFTVTGLTVTAADTRTQPTITMTPIELEVGENITLSATSSAGLTISYVIKSGSDKVSLENGVLTATAVGSAVITASTAETAEYKAASKDVNVTVSAATAKGISALRSQITSTDSKNPTTGLSAKLTNAVVTYVSSGTTPNIYIEDATAGINVYAKNTDLAAGDVISGVVTGSGCIYNGLTEMTAIDLSAATKTTTTEIPCTDVTLAELNNNMDTYESRRVRVTTATVTSVMDNRNATISQNGSTVTVREGVSGCTGEVLSTVDEVISTIVGYPQDYNTTKQLMVYSTDDITMAGKANTTVVFNCADGTGTAENPIAFTIGEDNTFPTATVKDSEGNAVAGATITYSSTNNAYITVNATTGVLDLLKYASKSNNVKVTATYAGDATHKGSTATYYLTITKGTPVIAFAEPTLSVATDAENAGLTATTTKGSNLTISYSSSNTEVASFADADSPVLTLHKAGTATITAQSVANDAWNQSVAVTYTLTVTKATTSTKYVLADNITDGEYVIVVDDNGTYKAMTSTLNDGYINAATVDVSYEDLSISNLNGAAVWTVSYDPNSYELTLRNGSNYISSDIPGIALSTTSETYLSMGDSNGFMAYTEDYNGMLMYSEYGFGVFNSSAEFNYTLLFFKKTTYREVPISSVGYATYVTEQAMDFGSCDDITAYKVSVGTNTVTLSPVEKVPANEAIVVAGNGGSYNVPVLASADKLVGNSLTYSNESVSVDVDNKYYVLAYQNEAVCFAPVASGSTIGAKKGYFTISNGSAANYRIVIDENETDLTEMPIEEGTSSLIYNISGQRVNKVQKSGLYIVNGKTQLIKK